VEPGDASLAAERDVGGHRASIAVPKKWVTQTQKGVNAGSRLG
jgi:hypothetical protein